MAVKIIEKNNKIKMTRSDTLITNINILTSDGGIYEPAPTDQIRFALKKDYNDPEPLIIKQIPADTMQLRIETEDTSMLEQPGQYVYDIQITYGDNIVSTIISSTLEIVPEVE